ncbi:thiamine diphosphokinase [Halobacillus locisalis]|uniref:Thiamine diphosphokinase n=1 Tax=Halobacillus locisalis TaxID=220753 RepID=A0A838CQE7_9BACI|nr:thiamine diphosphokinase [Halobacillus locisalis]MBA2174184.1 thiamine diphosphokinase [Halobacillus locisalis]
MTKSKKIAVVGGSPKAYIPDLKAFDQEDMVWIGADQGAEVLIENDIVPDIAIGDFDSVSKVSKERIKQTSQSFVEYPDEKDETDLELAINEALKQNPSHIVLFGVTGGRIDHSLANIQLLYPLMQQGIKGTIIDQQNQVELVFAGEHTLKLNEAYPYVSFLPVTLEVSGITLKGFYYPLDEADVPYGSTLCISNQLIEDEGTFSFHSGILLVIRSKDLNQ